MNSVVPQKAGHSYSKGSNLPGLRRNLLQKPKGYVTQPLPKNCSLFVKDIVVVNIFWRSVVNGRNVQ